MATFQVNTLVIFLLGPPGAGKGTLGSFLKKHVNVEHISVGDMLRRIVNEGPGDDWKVRLKEDYMAKNQLVPSKTLLTLLRKEMEDMQGDVEAVQDRKKVFVIDGCPRSEEQAKLFEEWICKPDLVIVLNCDEDIALKRLLNRARSGDSKKVFEQRHKEYVANKLLIEMKYQSKIHRIDVNKSFGEAEQQILQIPYWSMAGVVKTSKPPASKIPAPVLPGTAK